MIKQLTINILIISMLTIVQRRNACFAHEKISTDYILTIHVMRLYSHCALFAACINLLFKQISLHVFSANCPYIFALDFELLAYFP